MSRKSKIVNISLSPKMFSLADQVAQRSGKSRSELFRDALRQFLFSDKRWEEIRKRGDKTVKEMNIESEEELYDLLDGWRE